MRKLLSLFLYGALMIASAFPAIANEDKFEYLEYETIVLSMLFDTHDSAIPNWRELYLRKVKRYEEFLNNHPNSLLLAEVKLRIAEFYKDVEKEEVYQFRVELYRCLSQHSDENGGTLEKREKCFKNFYENTGKWRDPVYSQKAVKLLLELVRDFGHVKRYSMKEPRIGGFNWIDEEIGARSLYILSEGTDQKNKEKILSRIIREYKTGPKLLHEINEDLKKLKEKQNPSATHSSAYFLS